MVVKEIIERFRAKREMAQGMKDQEHAAERMQEVKKSSNERELERFIEERREGRIKKELGRFREKQKVDDRKSTMLSGKNIFKGHDNMLKDNSKLFSMSISKGSSNMMFHKSGFGG